jgi:hypothetical protein
MAQIGETLTLHMGPDSRAMCLPYCHEFDGDFQSSVEDPFFAVVKATDIIQKHLLFAPSPPDHIQQLRLKRSVSTRARHL